MAATNKQTVQQTQLDYFMDVLLRNYCRVMEENEAFREQITEVRSAMSILFQENADMRHMLAANGLEAPVSEFIPAEDLAEIETLGRI